MNHATTVPATAQPSWPYWWKTAGMGVMLKAGDTKFVFYSIPAEQVDKVSSKLAVGDTIQYGSEKITITEVYKAGFTFDKAGYPRGSIKPATIGIFYKADTPDPYTLQAQAISNILGLTLASSIAVEAAVLELPNVVKQDDTGTPVKNPVVVTPVGEGLPDMINQLSQFMIIGGLVVIGYMAFKKYAR